MKNCVCGSHKPVKRCCARFLDKGMLPKTPEQLMRSRYTAYALGGYGQYLLDTWFPATSAGLDALELSKKSVDWQRLEVLSKSQKGDDGEVEFKAYFKERDAGELACMHEHSAFKRVAGRWYYVGVLVPGE